MMECRTTGPTTSDKFLLSVEGFLHTVIAGCAHAHYDTTDRYGALVKHVCPLQPGLTSVYKCAPPIWLRLFEQSRHLSRMPQRRGLVDVFVTSVLVLLLILRKGKKIK